MLFCAFLATGCAIQSVPGTKVPLWLDYSRSTIVREDLAERYRCREGFLIVERISSGRRRLTCGTAAIPALLR